MGLSVPFLVLHFPDLGDDLLGGDVPGLGVIIQYHVHHFGDVPVGVNLRLGEFKVFVRNEAFFRAVPVLVRFDHPVIEAGLVRPRVDAGHGDTEVFQFIAKAAG